MRRRSPRVSGSPETRRTYAAVYRTFCTFLGPEPTADDLTPKPCAPIATSLSAQAARRRRSPSTSPRALDADPAIRTVRSQSVVRGEPRALSEEQFSRLLRMSDRRTRQGKRDLALLQLLGSAHLRAPSSSGTLSASGADTAPQAIAGAYASWC